MGRLDADALVNVRRKQRFSGHSRITRSQAASPRGSVTANFARALSAAVLVTGLTASSAAFALAPAQPRLDQARNGTAASPISPVDFQNGNAGASNSHYVEGMSIPYRIVFPNLELGTHTVVIEWDILQGGLHAIDYITHFDRLQPHSGFTPAHAQESINPLLGIDGSFGAPTTFAIPPPSAAGSPVTGQPLNSFNALPAAERVLTMYNGDITSAGYVSEGSLVASQSSTRMSITFNATSTNVVLAWGGHIASRTDWGTGTSAGQISGSSYHTRLIDLDGSGGNQDRSLSASAVLAPVACVLTGPTASCPSATETFGSQTTGTSYLWTVTGDATIVGSSTGSTIEVLVAEVCGGSYTVQLQQTDPLGTTTCTRVVPVQDALPPVITCPEDITVECGASIDPSFTGTATAVDGCGPNVTITFGDATRAPAFAAAACVPRDPIERTWTATDACGNTSTCVQIISFVDTTPPDLTCPPDITVECGASIDPIDTGSPSSTDNCDPTVTITFGDATRAPAFAAASACVIPPIERTWTATDDCGNTSTCVQLITFVDTTPPVITCPADVVLECGASSDPAETGSATATDGCDPTITITFGDASRGPALATAANVDGCAGPGIDRTWTATDDCGNTSTCVQHITFVDTTPPVITCPADVVLECGASVDPAETGSATATDSCDPNITITFGDASRGPALAAAANGDACAGPGIDRTWTATDDCGNTSTCVQRITFVDTTPPVITCPADVALECGSPSDPEHTGSATATDGCDPTITITFGDATRAPALRSGLVTAGTCAGAIIDRTWTATDDCGNSSSCVQVISFVDTQPPSIDCPDDVVRPACDNVVTWESNATDACDAAPTVSFVPPSGTAFPLGATTVTGTATDACGNTASCSFTVTVSETKGSPITGPAAVCKGQSALLCGIEGAVTYAWTGPGGFTGDQRCVSVTAAGTYVLETTFAGQKCTARSEHVLGIADPPVCAIDGPSTVCSGGKATLCGPNGNYGYTWTGPGGFTAVTSCIEVGVPGTYQLVVTDLETKCASLACTHELSLGVCDLVCPRTAGFWAAQCDQVPTGQTKFNASQMAQIAGLVDAKAAIFSWPDGQDFPRFCTTVSNGGSMDQRRQAKRQFAAFLANVSTGELGLVASNGIQISLSASTAVSCDGLSSTTVGALIDEVDALLVSLEPQSLTDATVKARYSQVITCLNAINNAVGFTLVCGSAAPENALYQDPPSTAGVGDRSLELRRPTPNPFTSTTRIAYEIPTGGRDAFVGVFDVAGRNVKTLFSGSGAPGRYELTWDGRDDHGSRVKSGVYFVRVVAGGTARTLPVVYLDR